MWMPEQIDAMPTGPARITERPITEDDIKAGKRGNCIVEYEMPGVLVSPYSKKDQIAYLDTKGGMWSVGQWADGAHFKVWVG